MTEEMILVSFGLMVRSYFNNNSVIWFLFIRSSGFGLMASSLQNWFRFYSFTLNFGGFFQDKLVELKCNVSFLLFQAKFVELMCIRSESAEATESAVDAVVQVVKELVRKFCLIIVLLRLLLRLRLLLLLPQPIRINFQPYKQLP